VHDGIFLQLALHYHLIRLSVPLQKEEREGEGEKSVSARRPVGRKKGDNSVCFPLSIKKALSLSKLSLLLQFPLVHWGDMKLRLDEKRASLQKNIYNMVAQRYFECMCKLHKLTARLSRHTAYIWQQTIWKCMLAINSLEQKKNRMKRQ